MKLLKKKFKIGYFADGLWAQKTLYKILQNKTLEVVFVIPRYNKIDKSLKKIALKNNIDFIIIKNVNKKTNINKLKKYKADLYVSMSFNQIIKKELLLQPKCGFINCHAGALPFYRGRNVLNWALINDEKFFGVSVHFIDEGIDTGDLILQKKYKIRDKDNYSSLLIRASNHCSALLYKAIISIKERTFKKIKQSCIDKKGSYYRGRNKDDEFIKWSNSGRKIFNHIRAISEPGPGAKTKVNDDLLILNSSIFKKNKISKNFKPGTIISIKKGILVIKTIDGILNVKKYIFLSNENKLKPGIVLKS